MNPHMKHTTFILLLAAALGLSACKGMTSDKPPVHLVLDMDYQERFEAQEANAFFADGRGMRPPVAGTVARGMLRDSVAYYFGRDESRMLVSEMPVRLTRAMLERGQDRYNVFCSMCHGFTGDGKGVVMTGDYGYVPAPTYHDNRLRAIEDGHMFDVIGNGIRNMPGYGYQLPVEDRWAIVAYIRALQRSQHASLDDIPEEMRASLETIEP
jgi:hypothetical protein